MQIILVKPVTWMANKFSSKPNRERVHNALSKLLNEITTHPGKKGLVIDIDQSVHKNFIIFSDQHKGTKNGADDFAICEPNYLQALDYYHQNNYCFISLGDCEELWENKILGVRKHNTPSFEAEKKFASIGAFIKIFGNHDTYWNNDPFAFLFLKWIYGQEIKIYDGLVLLKKVDGKPIKIFLTHGHQGDGQSDANKFSAWFVSNIWAPLQSYLELNPNTPAYEDALKTLHNSMMYEWSAQHENMLLITGHTHQPAFASMTHLERLYKKLLLARAKKADNEVSEIETEIQKRKVEYKEVSADYLNLKPTYFNSGCCCYSDGDITGIEILKDEIILVKWKQNEGKSERQVLEKAPLSKLFQPDESAAPTRN
jgi:predicted phosphodiesterase